MALAKTQKIQLIAISEHKDAILESLQSAGVLEIKELNEETQEYTSEELVEKLQKADLNLANVDFAIKILSDYSKKKGMFAQPITLSPEEVKEKTLKFDYEKITTACSDIEDEITKAKNEISMAENELTIYDPWKSMNIDLENLSGTNNTSIILGTVKSETYKELEEKLSQISDLTEVFVVEKNEVSTYFGVIFNKELEKIIRETLSDYKFTETEFPKEEGLLKNYLRDLQENEKKAKKLISEKENELKSLAAHLDDLMIAHDYFSWEKEKLEEEKKLLNTKYSFVLTGWLTKKSIPIIEEAILKITKLFALEEIEPEEGEAPPVVIKNNKLIEPFEAVTSIYGLPLHTEIDPTPFLAAYFIVFFGMCLTDAGYGLFMFIIMALALTFMKLQSGVKKLVKLLMYGGIITFVIGAIFGGWFGLTPDQVPESLTYVAENGEKLFIFQKINSLTDPLTVLILALGIGFVQILMGTFMKLIHGLRGPEKMKTLLDVGPWAVMLTGIGFTVLTSAGVLDPSLSVIGKWWLIAAVGLLILTQGRDKKNIFGKLISGILSLYDLVGYLSDVLSYSRLLALGLATAIIGLAVNIIAELMIDMIPYVGYVFAALVFVGGHIFNLIINALGSFIHSGRLQFVEFFGKFLEGGGRGLKPFSKKVKYVFIEK